MLDKTLSNLWAQTSGDILADLSGLAVLGLRVAGVYRQSRHPEAINMKKAVIPTHAMTTLSYTFNGATLPAIGYGGAALRSWLLTTHWGEKHKNAVSAANVLIMAGITAAFYEDPKDLLALGGTTTATIADYQSQGRYSRLIYLAGRATIWPAMAYAHDNIPLLCAELFSLGIQAHGVYKHDIKRASGRKGNKAKDIQAYLHGILTNSATGADAEGQIARTAATKHAPTARLYVEKLKKDNPFFTTQRSVLAHYEATL